MRNAIIAAVVALVFGFAGAALWQASGLGERATRAYLLENPELLAEMSEAYQRKQSATRLADVGADISKPFPGAVLGNAKGSRTLVEFSDYGCTYCRMSVADVERLVAGDPELRVVVREWPIFEGSEDAARMALAAANQGKYTAFHHAMFESGPPSPASIESAARTAGLDLAAARTFAASEAVSAEIAENRAMAQSLGFSGTPSWVAGSEAFEGAIGHDRLAAAIARPANR